MKLQKGQVALYLLVVIVAIFVLLLMNINTFLFVRAKNRIMNAGDASAIAAAEWQMDCLNRIGYLNIDHLNTALDGKKGDPIGVLNEKYEECARVSSLQARICLIDPIEGIRKANEAARKMGAKPSETMRTILREHVEDVKKYYMNNPDAYPEAWEGAWAEYVDALSSVLTQPMYAGPDNVQFIDAVGGHMLLNKQFYHAIGGLTWCWFKFNSSGLLSAYSDWRYWSPLPSMYDDHQRRNRCANSEVYSLHLVPITGSALDLFGTNIIIRVTGRSLEDVQNSAIITNQDQIWYCYDHSGMWGKWSDYPGIGFNSREFPIIGDVKPKYNVLGAAAICRTISDDCGVDMLWNRLYGDDSEWDDLGELEMPEERETEGRSFQWSAAAKPFGTVFDDENRESVVTALGGLVTPAFSEVRMVPVDSVGGRDLSTADPNWMNHVRYHLAKYLSEGPALLPDCYYCNMLRSWERPNFRQAGIDYLKNHGNDCNRSASAGRYYGGTAHGH